ncbi:hypothetical protein [Haloferula sp. A504]|uniref:hypothetical protein n=1 Tax=Haloferula sp. A504 TaxID=3373601 RepID=UPI0031CBBBFF|nr:hypothetical protein [Verrucomicrobiaceae bacterium E54]
MQAIHAGASSCPHCGFDLARSDERFSDFPRSCRLLEDRAGLIRSAERKRVMRLMSGFSARFPQLSFALHTGSGAGKDLREFGFWLINRASFEDLPEDRDASGLVLLAIDADAHMATLCWGYRIDGHLSESDTFQILSRAHAYWVEERYGEGVERVIEQLAFVLVRRSRKARRLERKGGGA